MEENKQILFIVNPVAGNLNKDQLITEVKKNIAKTGSECELYKTCGKEDAAKINSLIARLRPSRVIIAGGDGTIKMAAEILAKLDIALGIIPAGSANGLAFNLGLTILPLFRQIEIALGENFKKIDVLGINGEYCLHMSDFGVNAELIKNYHQSNIHGKFGYLLHSIPTLIRSKYPFEFEINTEKASFKKKGILLAFANFQKYGTGANINPHGKPDDGIFEIIVFKEFDILEIFKTLRNEDNLDPEFAEIIQATHAKVRCYSPVAFQIDGEYIGEKEEIEVTIIPKKLKIAVPIN
ncbi:MAG TPA: YegS/Rv2252/BmrU family lipid kinase [Salegentibacter sp.]|uniref:diacylglycerol/lipid kinase family protein n=1 Tax=Salegentibacter sp. TaxID=1903072 RepID=UPI002F9553D4